jgi:hypothetical protein
LGRVGSLLFNDLFNYFTLTFSHADMNRGQAPFIVLGTILNKYTSVAPNNSRLAPPRRAAPVFSVQGRIFWTFRILSGSHPSSRTRSLRIDNNQFESSGAGLAK